MTSPYVSYGKGYTCNTMFATELIFYVNREK